MSNSLKLSLIALIFLSLGVFLIFKGIDFKAPLRGSSNINLIKPTPTPREDKVKGISSETQQNQVKVLKVIDGDTIEIEYQGRSVKLRYIGVNTPETVDPRKGVECFGKEASAKNKELVEGKFVSLEKDVSETDKFGRLLRYVYLPLEDGSKLFINDYLVREGFANASTFPPDVKYQQRFAKAQEFARLNKKGLWNICQK